MPALNVFVDGTWLLVQCAAGQSMANATETPTSRFALDFAKLNHELLAHIQAHGGACDAIGDCYIATSIFSLPADFDNWPTQFDDVTTEMIERTRRAVFAREAFVRTAAGAGYQMDAVFRPPIKAHIIRQLAGLLEKRYQEKQVDTSVVALLVRSAITKPDDYHVLITGDADILPAVRVAYPQFTKNVVIATTHPDELDARHRQTAFALLDFDFAIEPYYMQNKGNAEKLLEGDFVYRCEECGKVFALKKPVPKSARPRCVQHRAGPARRPTST